MQFKPTGTSSHSLKLVNRQAKGTKILIGLLISFIVLLRNQTKGTMYTMLTQTLIEAPKLVGAKVSEKNEMIMRRWEIAMSNAGRTVKPKHLEMILTAMREWDAPTEKGRPSLINFYAGFGKSALLEFYLWEKLRDQNPVTGRKDIRTNFGAIIVKPTRASVCSFVDKLNRADGNGRTQKLAFGLYGYDPEANDYLDANGDWHSMTPDRATYDRQKTEQANYNIIVMTHEKLKQLSLAGELDHYRSFFNDKGERCDRPLLIIDEKPTVIECHTINYDDITDVLRWAVRQTHDGYKRFCHYAKQLREILEDEGIEDKSIVEPIRRKYLLDKRIAYQLGTENAYDKLAKLRAIEHLIRYGGMVTNYKEGKERVMYLSCAIKVHYDWTHLNASILDATGHLAMELALINEQFTHIRQSTPPRYENLHYYVSKASTLSKGSLKNQKPSEVVSKMAEYCKQIGQRHKDVKFLVITYKKYEESLEKALAAHPNLRTKYFDGGRESNDYIDCDGVIFLGNYFKPTDYYIRMASTIHGREFPYCEKTDINGLKFTDDNVEDFRLANQLEDFMQELSRTRPMQKDSVIPVYMFTKDRKFIEKLKGECPGSTFDSYEAPVKVVGKEVVQHEIAKLILSMKAGDRLKKSEWYTAKGIPKTTFNSARKTETVQSALKQNNVTDKGQFFVKES